MIHLDPYVAYNFVVFVQRRKVHNDNCNNELGSCKPKCLSVPTFAWFSQYLQPSLKLNTMELHGDPEFVNA